MGGVLLKVMLICMLSNRPVPSVFTSCAFKVT